MANRDEDEDFFLNDDLDDIPVNTLHELETQALLSTQRQPLNPTYTQTITTPTYASTPNVPPRKSPLEPSIAIKPSNLYPDFKGPVSDGVPTPLHEFDIEDEDVIDLDKVQGLPLRNAHIESPLYVDRDIGLQHKHSFNQQAATSDQQEVPVRSTSAVKCAKLQNQVEELERGRAVLLKSIEAAKSTVIAKAGEIAIIRRNHDRTVQDYERRISVMQKLYEDRIAKQRTELDSVKKDREKMETNNLFLEYDIIQEAERSKSLRNFKEGFGTKLRAPAPRASPAATPKKTKILPFRDGFDDGDILMLSPTKVRDKYRTSTPKAGSKRKRIITEQSPSLPLAMSEPRREIFHQEPIEPVLPDEALSFLAKFRESDKNFEFLLKLLVHHPSTTDDRVFEAFGSLAFPSAPDKSLSSIIFDRLGQLASHTDSYTLSLEFCNILMTFWEQCLTEACHRPLRIIINTLQFILAFQPLQTAILVSEKLICLITSTCDLVSILIARASKDLSLTKQRDHPLQVQLRKEVDVTKALSLLHTIALSCVTSDEMIKQFWKRMVYDFVLLMLMKAQPLPQILLMLQTVSTSALSDSFGAIIEDAGSDKQTQSEAGTIDRVTNLLFETPETLPSEDPYSSHDIAELRLEVLNTITSICYTCHGGKSLAQHRYAIGRLARFLHEQIDLLYSYRLDTHRETIQAINTTMRILHDLCTTYSDIVDVRQKLLVIPGGIHKHLAALTRLAFSDALVLEAGVEEETIDAAHHLLDEYLSPEEGDALLAVFSSGRSEV